MTGSMVVYASCPEGQENNTEGNEKSQKTPKKCLTKSEQCVNISKLFVEQRAIQNTSKKFGKT